MAQSDRRNQQEDKYADKFPEAANDWDLDRLYSDLRDAKQKLVISNDRQRLTDVDKVCLRGLLSGYSSKEIAREIGVAHFGDDAVFCT